MSDVSSNIVRLPQRSPNVHPPVGVAAALGIHTDSRRSNLGDHLKALDALSLRLRDLKGVMVEVASEFRTDCIAVGAADLPVRLKELQDMIEAQERAMHRFAGAMTAQLHR